MAAGFAVPATVLTASDAEAQQPSEQTPKKKKIDEIGQLKVDNFRFQVGHAVLNRSSVGQHLRNEGVLPDIEGPAWNLITDLSGHCEGSQPAGVVWKIAKALAEIERRGEQAIRRSRSRIGGTGAAPIDELPTFPRVMRACPSLWLANSGLSGLDWWLCGFPAKSDVVARGLTVTLGAKTPSRLG
jgi:hypothetical protein